MANSEPVVLASDQSTVPVSLASVPSHAVTNAGTFAVQNTAATPAGTNNIGDVDVLTVPSDPFGVNADAASITGSISAKLRNIAGAVHVGDTPQIAAALIAGQYDDVSPSSVTENNVRSIRMSARRELYTQIRDAAGNERGLNIAADGSVAVTVATVPSHAVTNAGTFVTQENGALLTAAQLLDDTVFADDAAVTLSTSKGNLVAGVAVNTDGTDPTAVSAEGDAAALRTDMNRILLVNQTHPRGTTVSADYASAQTNTSVIAAPGASLSIYITDIMLSNGATAGNVTLLDGSGGTVKWEAYPAVNGGAVLNLRQPIKLTANTALCITSTTVTTHSIFIGYYIAA